MDKENVVYIYNGVLLNQKGEENYVICRKWIVLEIISEVKQFYKGNYNIFSHM
jgi:hypothetical protein